MMIRRAVILLLLLVPMALYASPEQHEYDWDLSEAEMLPYNEAIEEFFSDRESEAIGELTVGELRELGAQLSVVAQEEDYVRRARQSSHIMPGTGHFMIGEGGLGAAFTTGSIVVMAGTVVGAYMVLPDAVQFDELDYINDSFRDIGQAWRGESISSMLPAFGVLLAGGIVHGIIGEIVSNDAEKKARKQIDSGEKRFEAQPFIYPDAHGRLMLGARIGL